MATWFGQNADFDYDIERRFGKLVSVAAKGGFDSWQQEPKSALALIILLDQFPRNLFRDMEKAFATDAKALLLAKQAIEEGYLNSLSNIENVFLLMPFQHAEDLEDQLSGLEQYQRLVAQASPEWQDILKGTHEFARRHHKVIEQFGRFPHRNLAMGRTSTPGEKTYLEEGGESF